MIRDNCATEISVGDGMASTSSSRAWTRYLAAASRGHRGNPQKHMTYRNSANVNPVDGHTSHGHSTVHPKRAGGMLYRSCLNCKGLLTTVSLQKSSLPWIASMPALAQPSSASPPGAPDTPTAPTSEPPDSTTSPPPIMTAPGRLRIPACIMPG